MCTGSEHSELNKRIVQGTRDSFDEIQDTILGTMREKGYSEHDIFSVRIAFEESLANALLHGHQGDDLRGIEVSWKIEDQAVEITVTDEGRGYDPNAIPDPTAEENLKIPSGRGLAMMRAFMDDVQVNEKGNEVKMIRAKRNDD